MPTCSPWCRRKAGEPGRGDRCCHRPVMAGGRDPVEQFAVVQQGADEGADRHPGQRTVVGAATAAEPHSGAVHANARAEHHVRGGGSYDRALARVPVGTFVCALLYDGELLDRVPAAGHDRPVTAAVTPTGLTRLPTAPG